MVIFCTFWSKEYYNPNCSHRCFSCVKVVLIAQSPARFPCPTAPTSSPPFFRHDLTNVLSLFSAPLTSFSSPFYYYYSSLSRQPRSNWIHWGFGSPRTQGGFILLAKRKRGAVQGRIKKEREVWKQLDEVQVWPEKRVLLVEAFLSQ